MAPDSGWLKFVQVAFPYEALLDVGQRSRETVALSSVMDTLAGVHWFTEAERTRVFTGELVYSLHRFQALFPAATGALTVSRVGFNRSRTHAALHVYRWCGPLCGSGGYTLLRRRSDGEWVIVGAFSNTIS